MINHISISARNPEKVAGVLAELWNGYAFPFPVCPNSFMALADDGRGTMVEVTPINIELLPGEIYPLKTKLLTRKRRLKNTKRNSRNVRLFPNTRRRI